MALEIERRFLVAGQAWRDLIRSEAWLRQGYLIAGQDGLVLRVRTSRSGPPGRMAEASAWLTIKAQPPPAHGIGSTVGPGEGALTRLEFEYPIPLDDAAAMLALTPHQLQKRRYGLELPSGDWVVDVFEGDNAPLVVAEVELVSADQAVSLPPWCGLELTGRHELSNAALALRPLQAWPARQREALLL